MKSARSCSVALLAGASASRKRARWDVKRSIMGTPMSLSLWWE